MKKLFPKILALTSAFISLFLVGTLIGTAMAQTPVAQVTQEAKAKSRIAVAQDMYLDVYKLVNEEPSEKAFKETAKKLGMSEDDVKKVINEGDISKLLKKDEKIETITEKYNQVLFTFQNALASENLKADLKSISNPAEIFKDGDTSNSDFDLLYDLTVIEIILFNEASTSEFGGQFVTPEIDLSDPNDKAELEDLFGTGVFEEDDDADEGADEDEEEDFSGLVCFDDESNLDRSLDDFASGQADRDGDLGEGESGDLGDAELDDEGLPIAPEDDWLAQYLCPDGAFFCIEVTFDTGTSAFHGKTANCVACHVQNINLELDKMLSKPLSANKVAGNLFEIPKCKNSLTKLTPSMNVITMAVPPPKQPNQDLYLKMNIDTQFNKIKEVLKPLYFKTGKAEDDNKDGPKQTDKATNKAISNLSPASKIEEANTRYSKIIDGQDVEKAKEIKTLDKGVKTKVQNQEYQTIIDELDAFKMYFNSMKEKFDEMYTPCKELSNKGYCT